MVTWTYNSRSNISNRELVKAYDSAHAWKLIKREHDIAITLDSIEEVE